MSDLKKKDFKSPAAVVNQRASAVARMLLQGRSRPEIIQFATQEWNIVSGTVDVLIKKATDLLNLDLEASRRPMLAYITHQQRKMYEEALADKNISVARQLLMDMAKLHGLDKVNVEMTFNKPPDENIRDLTKASDKELDDILELDDTERD